MYVAESHGKWANEHLLKIGALWFIISLAVNVPCSWRLQVLLLDWHFSLFGLKICGNIYFLFIETRVHLPPPRGAKKEAFKVIELTKILLLATHNSAWQPMIELLLVFILETLGDTKNMLEC